MTTYIIQWLDRNGHWHNLLADDGTNIELVAANHAKTVARMAFPKAAAEHMWIMIPVLWQIKNSHGEVVLNGST